MDTAETPTVRKRSWWEVGTPSLYFGIAGLDLVLAALAFFDPAGPNLVSGFLWIAVAALFAIAAAATVRRRGRLEPEPEAGPLAQESDPRLRHLP